MFALSSQPGEGFFLLVLSGKLRGPEICSANSFLVEMARQTRMDVVLLDIMGAEMMLSSEEAARTRAFLSENVPPLRRLAIAHKPEDDHGLVRMVAEARGIEVGQFSNLLDAERWVAAASR